MKLFDAVWAPSPRRVRIYLAEKGLEVDRTTIDMRRGEHLKPPYLDINPRGQVPALLLDCGILIDDSVAICRYFEALHPDTPLFGRTAIEIGVVESWIRRIESDCYAPIVDALRNRAPSFAQHALPGEWPPIAQIPALVERGRSLWDAFVPILGRRLADHEYLAGDAFSFADISAMVALDFAVATRLPDPLGEPAVARWHAAVSERPSAKA